MNRILVFPALALLGALCLQNTTNAHGGTYRGPGDTVPPGGGGGGGGGAGPSTPSPSGPSTGGPSGPSTPSPAGPAGVPTGGGGNRGGGPTTGGPGTSGPDLTLWEFWWGFNKDPYLNLKAAIYNEVSTDFEEAFLGDGTKSQKKNSLRPSESAIREKIVPALKEALEKERANDIVTGAMVALAKIGDVKNEEGKSELEAAIAKFLSDSQQEIAETAAVALGILANDGSVKTLENLVSDNETGRADVKANEVPYRTRAFAAYGLGLIGARTNSNQVRQEVATILMGMLNKPDTSTRDVKVACLVALGLTPIAIETTESDDKSATASRQNEIQWVLDFMKSENNHYLVRAHAPTAMARLLNGDSIKPKDAKQIPPELREKVARALLDALDDHSKEKDEVQQSCVLALGQIADTDQDKLDTEIRDRLMKIAEKSNDIQAKNFACISLAQIGGRQGAGEDNDKGVKALRNFLGEKMTKGSTHIRPWAGLSVGVMERAIADNPAGGQSPSGSQKEALRAALKDAKTPDEQGAYSIGCGIARDLEAKANLIDKLKQAAGDETRGYVAVSLGLIGDREAIKPIQDIVKESKYKPALLKQAAIGLGLLGDKELVQDMCTMLGEAKGLSAQAAIASALGFIGDSRSIDPLITMLKKKEGITDSARGFAAVALGIVADKEPLPWNSKISVNVNYRANTTTLTGENGTGILDIL